MTGPSPQSESRGQGERKLVTVLLVDLDEAREGFADLDPEDAGQLFPDRLARVRAEVEAAHPDLDTPRPARHTFRFVAARF